MKSLLQNSSTRKYFAYGSWTPDIARAQKFANPLSAISFSLQKRLKKVDMVLLAGNDPSASEIRVHLPDGC